MKQRIILIIGVVVMLLMVVYLAVNPARKQASAYNAVRREAVSNIYQALWQYREDHDGEFPDRISEQIMDIGTRPGLIDLGKILVPKYLSSIPYDPRGSQVDTLYAVYLDRNKKLVVEAQMAELGEEIQIVR